MTKKQIEGRFKRLESALIPYTDTPDEATASVKELYTLYDGACLRWLGGLFDKEIGGFYYSNSARDGDEFFPDIESTGQAIGLLEHTGAISNYTDIPDWMRSRIACFICSCEDPENGFFYNPQWSKEQTDEKLQRRNRDTRWAVELAAMCNFKIPYPTASSRLHADRDSSVLDYLKSEETLVAKLSSLDWESHVYPSMSWLASQIDLVIDAGFGQIALDHIASLRDPITGLWGEGSVDNVKKMKTLGGAAAIYREMRTPMPMSEELADFIFTCFDSDYSSDIAFVCARWTALSIIVNLLVKYGDKESVRIARNIIRRTVDNLDHLIKRTYSALSLFKKPDGSFSYTRSGSSPTSQSMVVAKAGSNEGDVNATILATGVPRKILSIITLSDDPIPVFSTEDVAAFYLAAQGIDTDYSRSDQ